jgi:hypothetical protein
VVAGTSIDLIVEVLLTEPLRLHVSLHQPDAAEKVAWVPRLLRPIGAFVRVTVTNTAGESMFATKVPKFKPKLKPGHDASYLPLEPGYSYGTVFDLDVGQITTGRYRLEVSYSNLEYQGTADRPLGDLELTTQREIALGL